MITSLTDAPASTNLESNFAEPTGSTAAKPAEQALPAFPTRPAWVEIDLKQLQRNFDLINHDKPHDLQVLSVVKDDGYGHGSLAVARTALEHGATFLAISTLEEAVTLRDQGANCRLLVLGDRQENELPWCVAHELT